MEVNMRITAAGNTEVPAYLVLIAEGYEISMTDNENVGPWFAQKDHNCFSASSPLELLGLVSMAKTRGVNWRATDQEIEAFLTKYHRT
jgi:hypothetical protein